MTMCCKKNIRVAHIAGSVTRAAECLIGLQLKVMEKIRLNIRVDFQKTPIEVTTPSSDLADEEHFFFAQTDGGNEKEKQNHERIKQSRKKATGWIANEEPFSMKPSIKGVTKISGVTTSYSKTKSRQLHEYE